ncbi:MAG: gamma-glutamylcyclotransferase [Rhodobacteraceae bacterium]|nr:MAG: gamma-glutamylcyclotransferase [Paracoccaceae bacterium]
MQNDLWVFGYGSLLWRPGFEYVERRVATLRGFNRSFCMSSVHYRGTHADPGLVLALDPDHLGECHGVGFRVAADLAADTMAYLRERELISSAYMEQTHPITFHGGGVAEAVCYVMDQSHEQYVGGLSIEEQAMIIAKATGSAGPNDEYLFNTVAHLVELGISDDELERLVALVHGAD